MTDEVASASWTGILPGRGVCSRQKQSLLTQFTLPWEGPAANRKQTNVDMSAGDTKNMESEGDSGPKGMSPRPPAQPGPGLGPGCRHAEVFAWIRPSLRLKGHRPCGIRLNTASPRCESRGPEAEQHPLGSCPGHGDGYSVAGDSGAGSSRLGEFYQIQPEQQRWAGPCAQGTENLLGPEVPTPGAGQPQRHQGARLGSPGAETGWAWGLSFRK